MTSISGQPQQPSVSGQAQQPIMLHDYVEKRVAPPGLPTAKNLKALGELDKAVTTMRTQGGFFGQMIMQFVGKGGQADALMRGTMRELPALKQYIQEKTNEAWEKNKASVMPEIDKRVKEDLQFQKDRGRLPTADKEKEYIEKRTEHYVQQHKKFLKESIIGNVRGEYTTFRQLRKDFNRAQGISSEPTVGNFQAMRSLLPHLKDNKLDETSRLTGIPVDRLKELKQALESEPTKQAYRKIQTILNFHAMLKGFDSLQDDVAHCISSATNPDSGSQFSKVYAKFSQLRQSDPDLETFEKLGVPRAQIDELIDRMEALNKRVKPDGALTRLDLDELHDIQGRLQLITHPTRCAVDSASVSLHKCLQHIKGNDKVQAAEQFNKASKALSDLLASPFHQAIFKERGIKQEELQRIQDDIQAVQQLEKTRGISDAIVNTLIHNLHTRLGIFSQQLS